jgi:hypothetical protein
VSGSAAGLERDYRRLMTCYPRRFRDEHGEELLTVLLASAADGQHRPRVLECADLIRNGLGMRLRPDNSPSARQGWSDALAVYSLVAPVLLLLATVAYPLTTLAEDPHPAALMSMIWPGVCLVLAIEAVMIALVLAGRRRTALAAIAPAIAVVWLGTDLFPQLGMGVAENMWTGLSVFLLEAVALIASPGPRHGRRLVHWGHWAITLAAVVAVQAYPFWWSRGGSLTVLGIAVAGVLVFNRLGRALRVSRYYRLLLAATFYAFVVLVCVSALRIGVQVQLQNDLGVPGELALWFAGPVLCAAVALGTAIRPRHRRII